MFRHYYKDFASKVNLLFIIKSLERHGESGDKRNGSFILKPK
jgi:hypothetical protein